jgi:predicted transcriptional regulator
MSVAPPCALLTLCNMARGALEVLGNFDSNIPSLGDAFRALMQRRFKHRTVKELEDRYGYDPKTVRNIIDRGTVSTSTLSKAVAAERWALWMQLGEELMGGTYEEFLQEQAHEHQRAAERAHARKDHIRRLEARASGLLDALAGEAPH